MYSEIILQTFDAHHAQQLRLINAQDITKGGAYHQKETCGRLLQNPSLNHSLSLGSLSSCSPQHEELDIGSRGAERD